MEMEEEEQEQDQRHSEQDQTEEIEGIGQTEEAYVRRGGRR